MVRGYGSRELAIIAAIVGAATISLAAFAGYDRFISPQGGVFCSTVSDADYRDLILKNERVCIGSGVDLATRSLTHMGDAGMYLIKNIMNIRSTCEWVDDRTFHPILDIDGDRIDINQAA